jgi:hypothetical protein
MLQMQWTCSIGSPSFCGKFGSVGARAVRIGGGRHPGDGVQAFEAGVLRRGLIKLFCGVYVRGNDSRGEEIPPPPFFCIWGQFITQRPPPGYGLERVRRTNEVWTTGLVTACLKPYRHSQHHRTQVCIGPLATLW